MSKADQLNSVFAQGQGAASQPGALATIESSRAIQEVQAALVIAKKFPRDTMAAYERIMRGCALPALAETALYAYRRGGSLVSGPSIRLAEMMAQNWGNLTFGVRELEQRPGESVAQAFCWDMETNTRQEKTFTVPHERHSSSGVKKLTDPRDIYETVANYGARRLRACILGVIPGYIQDAAVQAVEQTLKGASDEPIEERIRKMVAAFNEQFQVSASMIEAFLGHKVDATTEAELVRLKGVFKSLRDGMSNRDDWFKHDREGNQGSKAGSLNEALGANQQPSRAPNAEAGQQQAPNRQEAPPPQPEPQGRTTMSFLDEYEQTEARQSATG